MRPDLPGRGQFQHLPTCRIHEVRSSRGVEEPARVGLLQRICCSPMHSLAQAYGSLATDPHPLRRAPAGDNAPLNELTPRPASVRAVAWMISCADGPVFAATSLGAKADRAPPSP